MPTLAHPLYLTQDIMRKLNSLITVLALSISSLTAVGCATIGEDEYGESDDEAASAGKLSFWQASDGQWHFNLKSGNGAILQTSEAYTSRTGAINGALSVLENGVAQVFQVVGIAIGGIGTLIGVAIGLATCYVMSSYGYHLDPKVYLIDKLPIEVRWFEVVLVAGITMAVSVLVTLFPSLSASALRPAEGLRYD